MLFTDSIGVDCENHTNVLCGKLQRLLMAYQMIHIHVFTAKLEIGTEAGAKKQLMKSE
jgi:hypothetical protein